MTGEIIVAGIGAAEICTTDSEGKNSFQESMRSAVAVGAGVPLQQVAVTPECDDRRRGLSIKIDFKISLQTSSLSTTAITAQQSSTLSAMTSFVSSGAMSETFTKEATKRGEIVSVTTLMEVTSVLEEVLVVVDTKEGTSDSVFYAVAMPSLLMAGLLVLYWCALLAIKLRNGPGETTLVSSADSSSTSADDSLKPGIRSSNEETQMDSNVSVTRNMTIPIHHRQNEQLKAASLCCGYAKFEMHTFLQCDCCVCSQTRVRLAGRSSHECQQAIGHSERQARHRGICCLPYQFDLSQMCLCMLV